MRLIRKILSLLFISLIFVSCENLNEPGELKYHNSLLFNLFVNKNEQQIYIYNTLKPDDFGKTQLFSGSYFAEHIVERAKIKIYSDNQLYSNFEIKEIVLDDIGMTNKYYTNLNKMKLSPNTIYNLEIESNNEIIKGRTLTPGDFNILNYNSRNFIVSDSQQQINIEWDKSNNSKFYKVNLYTAYTSSRINNNDTIVIKIGFDYIREFKIIYDEKRTYDFQFDPVFDSVKVEVVAFDENYYDHITTDEENTGIENAYGYFGSAVIKEVIFINKTKLQKQSKTKKGKD